MNNLKCFLWIMLAVVAAGCRRQDVRDYVIDVPGLKNAACVEVVRTALQKTAGVKNETVVFDLKRRRVRLEYESLQLSVKNIEHAIAKAGFEANGVPPEPKAQAALPAECR